MVIIMSLRAYKKILEKDLENSTRTKQGLVSYFQLDINPYLLKKQLDIVTTLEKVQSGEIRSYTNDFSTQFQQEIQEILKDDSTILVKQHPSNENELIFLYKEKTPNN